MSHDVFISHSHKDKLIADAICANLEIAGARCWIAPRDIGPGEDWPTAIGREIPQSRVLVMIFSSNSNNSDQVYREVFLAANNNVLIIPFRIENVEPKPMIGYLLAGTHWLDAIGPPMQEQIDILVMRVKLILSVPKMDEPVRVNPIVTPSPTGSSNPALVRRIPLLVWGILTTILILAGGAGSFYYWGQTSKAIPLASPVPVLTSMPENSATPTLELQPVPALTKTPEISATPALNPQGERARVFAEPILAAIAQRKPDFEDDFSRVNPAWGFCDTSGTSAIEAGVARSKSDDCMKNDTALTGKDFILQLDARLVSGDTTSQIIIRFHAVSDTHDFNLFLHPAIQAWDVSSKWASNEFPTLTSGEDAVSPVGEITQITMITRGSRFALYLNQTPVGFFDNSNLDNAGKTFFNCMSASPAVCEFDNVKFWNLANIPGLP